MRPFAKEESVTGAVGHLRQANLAVLEEDAVPRDFLDGMNPGGELSLDVVVMVGRDSQLFEVVGASHAVGGLAHLLHRREQEADEDRDDGDHHQELDQSKGAPAPPADWYFNPEHRSDP